jgi:predicted ABC-type ATPase
VERKPPQLWVIAGPNGARKTTLVGRRVATRIPVINPDDIAAALPRIDGRLDERQAAIFAVKRRTRMLLDGDSFAIETTLTEHSALKLIADARRAGYKITLVFVGLSSVDLSMRRVEDRVDAGGHAVPVSALVRRYPEALAHFGIALKMVDRVFVFDNSGARRRLLLSLDDMRIKFRVRELPAWLRRSLPDHDFPSLGDHD